MSIGLSQRLDLLLILSIINLIFFFKYKQILIREKVVPEQCESRFKLLKKLN